MADWPPIDIAPLFEEGDDSRKCPVAPYDEIPLIPGAMESFRWYWLEVSAAGFPGRSARGDRPIARPESIFSLEKRMTTSSSSVMM